MLSLARVVPLADEARVAYRADWDRLRSENASLRIATSDRRLVSMPVTHFDERLLRQVRPHLQKTARVIGEVLSEQDAEIYEVRLCP